MDNDMTYAVFRIDNTVNILKIYIEDNTPSKSEFISIGADIVEKVKGEFIDKIKAPHDYSHLCSEIDRRFEGLLYSRFL